MCILLLAVVFLTSIIYGIYYFGKIPAVGIEPC